MSWFVYSDQQVRKYRKGIWLRTRCLPKDLSEKIKKNMGKFESLAWVQVEELRPNNQVLLEVWCYQFKFPWRGIDKPERYSVFHLLVDENPNWICEGDLGRGLVIPKPKPKKVKNE
jgi:hypothetical protein